MASQPQSAPEANVFDLLVPAGELLPAATSPAVATTIAEETDPYPQFPAELKELRRWVTWKSVVRDGRSTKILYNPITGRCADSTDPSTWVDYQTAVDARANYSGIGCVIAAPYVGIDLDKCRNPETGQTEPWALTIIRELHSYTEFSPSGCGYHFWLRGSLPPDGRRKGRVEMYNCGRYFTVTGDHVPGTPFTIETRDLSSLHARMMAGKLESTSTSTSTSSSARGLVVTNNGSEKLQALMAGAWQGWYTSQSEADAALCALLAYKFHGDVMKIDAEFRTSGLYREKWERPDYRKRTIERAIALVRTAPDGPHSSGQFQSNAARHPDLVQLSTVEPEKVTWLWDPYIPCGKLTLLEGDPSAGKTYAALAIGVAVTRGYIPGINNKVRAVEPATMIYMTAEDGVGDTLRPRFDSLGGDPTKMFVLRGTVVMDGDKPEEMGITLSDISILEEALVKTQAKLLVVDPLQAYLGAAIDLHRANEVRPVLAGLARLAERHGCAVIIIRHLAKMQQSRALYRGIGSIDLTAAARSVLLAGSDPNNPEQHALVHIKSSLAIQGQSVGYLLSQDRNCREPFSWTGFSLLTSGDLLAAESSSEERSAVDEAAAFLKEALASGPRPAREIEDEAGNSGIANKTLMRARKIAKVVSRKSGKGWILELPRAQRDLKLAAAGETF